MATALNPENFATRKEIESSREIELLEREALAEDAANVAHQEELATEALPPVVDRVPDQEIIGTLNMVVAMAAGALAPNWKISHEEALILSEATEAVLDKYMPNVKDNIGCEFALVMAVGAMILPRLHIPRFDQPAISDNEKTPVTPEPATKVNPPAYNGQTIDLGEG